MPDVEGARRAFEAWVGSDLLDKNLRLNAALWNAWFASYVFARVAEREGIDAAMRRVRNARRSAPNGRPKTLSGLLPNRLGKS